MEIIDEISELRFFMNNFCLIDVLMLAPLKNENKDKLEDLFSQYFRLSKFIKFGNLYNPKPCKSAKFFEEGALLT